MEDGLGDKEVGKLVTSCLQWQGPELRWWRGDKFEKY